MENDTPQALGALQVDETKLMGNVHEVVRSSVEETLNALLDAEADEICGAQRYERSADRVDTRAGHHERKLETKAGAVTLKVPKLRRHHRGIVGYPGELGHGVAPRPDIMAARYGASSSLDDWRVCLLTYRGLYGNAPYRATCRTPQKGVGCTKSGDRR